MPITPTPIKPTLLISTLPCRAGVARRSPATGTGHCYSGAFPTWAPIMCSKALTRACWPSDPRPPALHRPVELENQGRPRQGDTQFVGGLQHQSQVLLLEVDGESRTLVTDDYLRPPVGQHPRPSRPAGHRRQRSLQIEPAGLGRRQHVHHHQHLVDQLHHLPRAHRTGMGDARSHRLQIRTHPVELGSVPAHHDRQGPQRRSFASPAHRAIQPRTFRLLGQARQPPGLRGADGGVIHHHRTRSQPGQYPVGARSPPPRRGCENR